MGPPSARDHPPDIATKPDLCDQAEVERVLSKGFVWLRFPEALESAFIEGTADDRMVKILVAGLNSILVFGGILIADYLMMPGSLWLTASLRVGVYAPFVLGALVILHRLSWPTLTEWMVSVAGLLAGGIIMLIALLDVTPLVYTKVVELIIVSIYVSVFARFWPMVLLSVGLALMHAVVITHAVDVLGTVALGSSLLMGTTLLFTLVASYRMERNERLSFLLDQREQALGAALQEANQRLHDLARTDALTGVANRRYFDAFLAQSWRVAQDTGKSLGLLLIDVDHFKAYNDVYGHQAGDRCLCAVTEAIGQCLRRPVDLLARWGGEEFAVVIADTDGASLDHVAERIRLGVQGMGLVHAASSCAPVVTVSIGMASMVPASGDDLKDLMNVTDAALYQAKANGRNQVCACSQELVA